MRPISPTALPSIERELRQLERRREDLDRVIARLRRIAMWLRRRRPRTFTAEQEEPAPQSLTDGCRAVLRMSFPNGVTPREVKHLLTQSGVSWERFSNPMSAIHTVLKRLVQQHEAVATIGRDGQRRYAVKRTVAIALTRREADDAALMKKLLEANSPETIVELLKNRRAESR
jgi:hypothetical protein